MNRLVTIEKIRSRMTMADDPGINAALDSCLDAAIVRLNSVFNTSFDRGMATDLFYIDAASDTPVRGFYALKLSHGFLREAEPVTVCIGDTLEASQGDMVDPVTIFSEGFVVDHEKGYILVPVSAGSKYLAVAYTYGFEEEEEVPLWLQELATLYTVEALVAHQSSDARKGLPDIKTALRRAEKDTLSPHLRVKACSIPSL